VTKNPKDRGAFKTPTLRNVDRTAPYLHDGSVATLEEIVDLYNRGGGPGAGKSDLLFELGLTPNEKKDLVAFLHSLTGTMPEIAESR
jgi:cytochrome c peroxidase